MSESTAFRHQMPALTLREVTKNFSFRESADGRPASYHGLDIYLGRPDFCDIYFISENGEVTEQQIGVFNRLKELQEKHLEEIESYITKSLPSFSRKTANAIRQAPLEFEEIEIPFQNKDFDLCIRCSKSYKVLRFLERKFCLKVDIRGDQIISISESPLSEA